MPYQANMRKKKHVAGMDGEPPQKKSRTDFKLCLVCQKDDRQKLIDTSYRTFNETAYTSILTAIQKKAEYGNIDYLSVANRLRNCTPSDLKDQGASWHKYCFKKAINNLDRDKVRAERASTAKDSKILTGKKRGRPSQSNSFTEPHEETNKRLTRTCSTENIFDKIKCLFCQEDTCETVINCCTSNRGIEIQTIVEKSDNDTWKIRLSDVIAAGDLVSRDIVYHKSCFTKNWEKYIQRPKRHLNTESLKETNSFTFAQDSNNNFDMIAAEVQFFVSVQDDIDNGLFLSIPDLQCRYATVLSYYGISVEQKLKPAFKKHLIQHLKNAVVTESTGNRASYLHSQAKSKSVIHEAASAQNKSGREIGQLYESAKFLRHAIKESNINKWEFNGSLDSKVSDIVPKELLIFINWLLHGPKTAQCTSRDKEIERSISILSQQVVQHFKTDRQLLYTTSNEFSKFYGNIETPLNVGISLQSHHTHRSKKDLDILNAASIGISYSRVQEITNQIANSVAQSIKDFDGTYVPPLLLKGIPLRASADNLDKNVDTFDGRNSFHGTAVSVYQSVAIENNLEPIRSKLVIDCTSNAPLSDVPETVVDLHPCTIQGNPKPKESPHYETYTIGQHKSEVDAANMHDLLWLITRYMQRLSGVQIDSNAENTIPVQTVPVWRAYNSVITDTCKARLLSDKSHALPIINAPAHEWSTLVTVLQNLYVLNKIACPDTPTKVMATFDMDLYKRALKLEYIDDQYKGKWWLMPGAFHTSLCAIRCLGRTIEGSGIDDLWVKSGLYSEIVTNQVINGSHYNRAVDAHEVTLQLFADLWFESFFESHSNVLHALEERIAALSIACSNKHTDAIKKTHQELLIELEHLNLEKQLHDYDLSNNKFPMYKWCRMYMHQAMTLLNFHRSVKDSQFFLYLASLEDLSTYFFAYNRLDYAQHILEFTARAYSTRDTDPDLHTRLCAGEFVITKSKTPFTSIGIDQAQEHQNKILKGEGGLGGITTKPVTFLKYCLAAPELSRISEETNQMLGLSKETSEAHHLLSTAVVTRQERMLNQLKHDMSFNPFNDKGDDLYNLMTKRVLRDEAKVSILNFENRGNEAKMKFLEERIKGTVNLWDKMTKVKFLSWDDLLQKQKPKGNTRETHTKLTTSLMSRMLVVAKSERNLDLQKSVTEFEFSNVNHVLMNDDGSLLKCQNKSELIHALESVVDKKDQTDTEVNKSNRHLIIDAMAVVQAIMHAVKLKTCSQLGDVFSKAIDGLVKGYCCGRVIFDNYQKTLTIKDMIRYQNHFEEDILIEDCTPIGDKHDILSNNKTKDRLTKYLSDNVISKSKCSIVSVTRFDVRSNSDSIKPTTAVSTQEEADTLMILHAIEIVQNGGCVDFFTQDTDWFVLLLRRFEQLGNRPGIITGTYESRRRVELYQIYDVLGADVASALPGAHALTGSDTTGHIFGVGKKRALKVLRNSDHNTLNCIMLLGTEDTPSREVIDGCLSYLCCLLNSKDIKTVDPDELRWKKFKAMSSTQGIEKIPPTRKTWFQHILRAHMQARIWAQDLEVHPELPNPLLLGWKKDGDRKLIPVLTEALVTQEAVKELLKCNCGVSKCTRRCKCKLSKLPCTELCKCEASEECCNTNQPVTDI